MSQASKYQAVDLSSLSVDPLERLVQALDAMPWLWQDEVETTKLSITDFYDFLTCWARIAVAVEDVPQPSLNRKGAGYRNEVLPVFSSESVERIRNICKNLRTEAMTMLRARQGADHLRRQFEIAAAEIQRAPRIEMSDHEFARLQEKLNDIREIIQQSTSLDADHKRRLLLRLERLQEELHKTMPDFDRMIGVLLQLSAAAKQVGEDLTPLTRRVQEVCETISRVVWLFYGAPVPSLPSPDDAPRATDPLTGSKPLLAD